MEWDERAEHANVMASDEWFTKFRIRRGPPIANWVSSFRSDHPSEVVEDLCGSFNWSCRVRFEDSVEWLVRFAVPGRVMDGDEKLRREVSVMHLLREKTKIPVPKVHAWGLSKDNALGLGPFIIMEYIPGGESLGHLWRESNEKRILRSDISERDLRTVYRQIAGFYLELSKLEFPNVGSLSMKDDESIQADLGPLTLKMQEIEAHGGVKVGGNRSTTFPSARDYFDYVAEQDMEHLCEQPSSVDNDDDARAKFRFRHHFNAIIPRFVADEYNQTGFRLMCDDFRYGNMIVNNAKDLKIIAVIDWEWTYAAPYQMFCSAPRWFLIKPPMFWTAPNGSEYERYNACLEIFLEELEQEESDRYKVTPQLEPLNRLSGLMRKSMTDGRFWFHELIYDCFTVAENTAWKAIRDIYPNTDELAPISEPELEKFVKKKMEDLAAYKAEWDEMKAIIDRNQAEMNETMQQMALEDSETSGCSTEQVEVATKNGDMIENLGGADHLE
ncbi:hypothetical protein EJ05DRAFT_539672 [Pseudovirgaria hyperparasitica]|uniref:Aminoglycoside phosphotransferase domain-containing protein n=1 Tax=Pseudovirgaria hyperparasitica TaxID=470096 RepID=A0A6A6W4F0_9PEZI|nr:uncharacterized protein EJ05DRAFT_539672 [Pseudovirgaria hyperparasitica]KAF2756790.1 hypothetical protein EJ05DRAFT_539672 [Pseudovirgaria hyperparasitica]